MVADPPLELGLIENPGAGVTAPEVPLGFWEFYTVTDDDPADPESGSTSVCELTCSTGDTEQVTCCA